MTTAGTTGLVLQDASTTWAVNAWAGYSLEYLTGPAAGETVAILSNTANTLTTVASFNPAPDSSGDGFSILPISTLTDTGAAWTAAAYVGDYLEYTSGPAAGQWLQITANTANTLTTVAPTPAPTAAGGDAFSINSGYGKYEASTLQNVEFFTCSGPCSTTATVIPSWLESGASNTALDSVYWVNLPSGIGASGGSMTIYIGFASTAANLFSATGYTGETATQGPSYGIYDNGAIVFNLYDNFAGTTLSNQWAPSSLTTASGETATVAMGQVSTTTDYQNEGVSTITQYDTYNPSDAIFDSSGNLWVVDSGANRILEYVPGTAPCAAGQFCNGMAATVVLGQTSMSGSAANAGGLSASSLSNPRGIAFDSSGNLWVADSGNNRVLEFTYPFTTDEAATTVLGQASFVSNTANGAGAIGTSPFGAEDLNVPRAIAFDSSGDMWVADTGNNRVVEYAGPTFTTEQSAVLALGQASLLANGAAASAKGESAPSGLAISGGNVWVADSSNGRVLEYAAPLSTGMSATLELGQGVAAFTGTSTAEASGLLTDASATWTASQFVGYYLEYTSGIDVGQSALITANTFDTITTAAFGTLPTVGSTFAVIPFQDGGENQNFASPTSQTLDLPLGITFSGGNLWVADSGNNRVLEFTAPFTNGEAASKVIGQSSFTSYTISSSASGLDVPRAVAFDSAGDLWVTDTANNRILDFPAPLSSDEAATTVIGQPGFNQVPSALNLYDPADRGVRLFRQPMGCGLWQ